ncbi:MAG: HD domain-containing protein, partial [Bdellovibrionales bacterium]|nr:HD domain-containing protein [Bdellovibrionales bacterium]
MEIRDPIHGSIEFTPKEVAVLESPAFQRLRSIRQLGFGEFSYPGGTHSRFLHSIGVGHIAGNAFDTIFRGYPFGNEANKWRLRQTVKLAAMLHDVGHGPLSHTTEEVMPELSKLEVKVLKGSERQATHEDYTIKFITDSPLTKEITNQFPDVDPVCVAALINRSIECDESYFQIGEVNLRTILSQIVSSELDMDRMDYLLRDSYFCGINYGKVEMEWITSNLTHYRVGNKLHLALGRRAIYTFDDFLVSRHHMYLMVYFHHKALVYDEMLHRYLTSKDCSFRLPSDINQYLDCDDYLLHRHLRDSENEWARRISRRQPYRMVFELHAAESFDQPKVAKELLEKNGIDVIHSSSVARLSKY